VLYQAIFNAVHGPTHEVPRPYPIELTTLPAAAPLAQSMVPGTMTFYRPDTPSGSSSVQLQSATPAGAPLGAQLHPQVSVFPLA
jgi:hypothetical protein